MPVRSAISTARKPLGDSDAAQGRADEVFDE